MSDQIQQQRDPLPSREAVRILTLATYDFLLPTHHQTSDDAQQTLAKCATAFTSIMEKDPALSEKTRDIAKEKCNALVKKFPIILHALQEDTRAALRGDPAALSAAYVIASYPALLAICTYRIAHEILHLGMPTLARQMTEVAHSRTGIDIHPGAKIAPGFFIDHGTGVVIGETTIIGSNVRLYQGVTLGAGTDPMKAGRMKRHPTLEENVICYANSSILGPVRIGKGSRIGANATVFTDIPPHTLVVMPRPELTLLQSKNAEKKNAKKKVK